MHLPICVINSLALAASISVAVARPAISNPAASFEVPAPHVEKFRVLGNGYFNYMCQNGRWAVADSQTNLFDINNSGFQLGTANLLATPDAHGASLYSYMDGILVSSRIVATRPSQNPGSYPELTSVSLSSTRGMLGDVTYGQIINTVGGIAPSTPCTHGQSASVPASGTIVYYHFPN